MYSCESVLDNSLHSSTLGIHLYHYPQGTPLLPVPNAQAALCRIAHHVRALETIHIPVIKCIAGKSSISSRPATVCKGLTSIDFGHIWYTPADFDDTSDDDDDDDGQAPVPVFGCVTHPAPFKAYQEPLLLRLIQNNPDLQTLKIGRYWNNQNEPLSVISANLPHLQDLELFVNRGGYEDFFQETHSADHQATLGELSAKYQEA